MADGGLVKTALDLIDKFGSNFWLVEKERAEIIEKVGNAVNLTEGVFARRYDGSRRIEKNDAVADAWSEAGIAIQKYLPNEYFGEYLQMKSEAWRNPNKWNEEDLKDLGLKIEQIKSHIRNITNGINRLKNKPIGGTY